MKGRTVFITGASRGIGREIALRVAQEGANVVIAAKSATAHPKLPGTIFTVAEEVVRAGGQALPVECDIRDDAQIQTAVEATISRFGRIDIVVNNASAISLAKSTDTTMKKYDLMHQVNARGTFAVSRAAIPYLKRAGGQAHIIVMSPPLIMRKEWFAMHTAYTMSKYGMSMCVLGLAAELESAGVAVNALWPRTLISTAALQAIDPSSVEELSRNSRNPKIVAEAAYVLMNQPSSFTGNFLIDEDILRYQGVGDFSQYSIVPSKSRLPNDLFVDEEYASPCPPKQILKLAHLSKY